MQQETRSGTALICGRVHWERCAFENAALLEDQVTIAPDPGGNGGLKSEAAFEGGFAGLAFDRRCRLFHPIPQPPGLEYLLWTRTDPLLGLHTTATPFELSPGEGHAAAADPADRARLPSRPVALACDRADYLYIADPDAQAVWLVDVWQQEVARRISPGRSPIDLAAFDDRVFVLLQPAGWCVLSSCSEVRRLPWPEGLPAADRLDCAGDPERGGHALVLIGAGTADAALRSLAEPRISLAVPFCTDFAIDGDAESGWVITAARRPGEDFPRWRLIGRSFHPLTGLRAPHYDGRGIARAPDGRIAYWSEFGLYHAAPWRPIYLADPPSRVYGFALDSELDQNSWGHLTLEACIPEGTSITVYAFTRDDLEFTDALPRTAPSGETLTSIAGPDTTPLVSTWQWGHRPEAGQPLARTTSGPLLAERPAQGFAFYDAPVLAPPGRYLWLVFELHGSRHRSPRLRSARAAYPTHDLLRLLPRTLWRDPAARSFLTRYLMPIAAQLSAWGEGADTRHRLLDPHIAPTETLDWLAGFVGLAMDPCWPEPARRQMIAEAATLFRGRGTLASLKRMLTILTGAEVVILEHFRLRGGGVVGNREATRSRAVLGVGFRVGGDIGDTGEAALSSSDSFDGFAHRFTVTVIGVLSDEQLRCAARLIEAHKPAHTRFELCTIERGSRVGLGMHVGVSSVVGRSASLDRATVGDAVLGRGYLLGRPGLEPPDRKPGRCT